jgi:pyruvate kinase
VTPQSLGELIDRLDTLLGDFTLAQAEHAEAIAAVAEVHRAGAVNLVHYMILRRHDRRALQNDLIDIGVTSLATTEANVRAKVQAARNVLAALRGDPGPWDLKALNDALDHGDEILEANSTALFGAMRAGRPTRIMVTLPSEAGLRAGSETGQDAGLVTGFVVAGMDIARVNCAHDDPAAWARMADRARAAGAEAGRRVQVSMDLPGPKLRTGPILDGPAVGRARVTRDEVGQVLAPARLWLTSMRAPAPAPAPVAPAVQDTLRVEVDPDWLAERRVGDTIRLRDVRGRRRTFTVTQAGAAGCWPRGHATPTSPPVTS